MSKRKNKGHYRSRQARKNHAFSNWEDFHKLYVDNRKEVSINALTIGKLLESPEVIQNLKKSKGAKVLIARIKTIIPDLTGQLERIHELHKDKAGVVDLDSEDAGLVIECHQYYQEFLSMMSTELLQIMSALEALKTGPLIISNGE